MKKGERVFILLILATLPVLFLNIVSATGTQTIIGYIDKDLNAHINQSFPLDTNIYDPPFVINIPLNRGYGAIDYNFLEAHDNDSRLNSKVISGETAEIEFNKNKGLQDIIVTFKVPASFNTPVFIGYDFFPFIDDPYFKSPTLKIDYPSSLKLLSTKPISSPESLINLNYPNNKNSGGFYLNFIKTPIPDGYIQKDIGIFKVIGTSDEIKKLEPILTNLTFLPEVFTKITGNFGIESIWIFTTNLAGTGNLYADSGALAREPNIILLDKEMINNTHTIQLEELIVHEISHLVITSKVFQGQEKRTPWFDEGMPTFLELYLADNYFNKKGYWVDKDNKGELNVWWSTDSRFNKEGLIEEYGHIFDFDFKDNERIRQNYAHSGLVFYNFYLLVGNDGMKRFFLEIAPLNSSRTECYDCDNKKILKIMESISRKSQEELLFPYKNDLDLEIKMGPLLRKDLTQEEIDKILNDYVGQENSYKTNSGYLNYLIFGIIGALIFGIIILIIFKINRKKKK